MSTEIEPRCGRRSPRVLRWAAACLLCCNAGAQAPRGTCEPAAATVEVAAGVFVRPGHAAVVFEDDDIANIGFVVGERCVAVVDTGGSPAEGRALDCAIRRTTSRPVCYVLNTHVHPDHLLGNRAFARAGVTFIGHAKLARSLAMRGDLYRERATAYIGAELDESALVFPDRELSGTIELDIGGRTLTVRTHDSAHTDHDLSVVDERTGTAFVGDLVFLAHVPVIDGSINGWIAELERMHGELPARVVPGHGPAPAAWPAAGEPTLRYLTELRGAVRAWIAAGRDLASAGDGIRLSRSDDWLLYDRYHRRNVVAAYAELEWEE